jgi:hypothetical protein
MPKVELGAFGVVAGEELKKIPGGGCFLRLGVVVPRYLLASCPKKSSPPAAPSPKYNPQYKSHTGQKSAITGFRTSWGVCV